MVSSDVEKVKDRLSITEIVGQYVPLKRAGKNYVARCPFHKEKTPSFHVSPERGTYMCFGCGERGDIFSFVQKMEGSDFPTTLRRLAEKAGVTLTARPAPSRDKGKEERLRDVCEAAVAFFEAELAGRIDVQKYLETRGVQKDTAQTWRLGYAPASWENLSNHLVAKGFMKDEIVEAGFAVRSEKRPEQIFDRFRGRVMFPIFDMTGAPIAVSGRFFEKVPGQKEDSEPAKYINSPETLLFKKSKTLYGMDRARGPIRKLDCILLVEGQFDLILAHQSGLSFAVALSGTALTPEHLALLGRLSKRLVLALDADQAGIRSGLKSALMAFQAGFEVKVPLFPEGKDPADLARENPELLKAAVRTSQTAIAFFLDALRKGTKDERAYHRLVQAQILPLIAAMESSIDRAHFARVVAERLRVPETAVLAELAKVRHPMSEFGMDVEKVEEKVPEDAELSPLEKKIGMLLFHFHKGSPIYEKLVEVIGEEEVMLLQTRLLHLAETLRFRFEAELGEHTTEERVAEDMLASIADTMRKERFRMKFL